MTIAAIVVHHRSYRTVGQTVRSLLEDGVAVENLLVVDNTPGPEAEAALAEVLDPSISVLRVANRGYGDAVNHGLIEVRRRIPDVDRVIVSTHECRVRAGATAALSAALDADPDVGLAGPMLVTGKDEGTVWSVGGVMTRFLRLPRHVDHKMDTASHPRSAVSRREWLDGAFVLYRAAALSDAPFDPDYFLYMEEVDLHLTLRSRGWTAIVVPPAVVWQSSSGIPPYALGRNMQWLQQRHGTPLSKVVATPWSIARRAAADVVHRRGGTALGEMVEGWWDAVRRRPYRGVPPKSVNATGSEAVG